jgi:decaprenylphospho-beta-D-ribofuranose 2-oxidase
MRGDHAPREALGGRAAGDPLALKDAFGLPWPRWTPANVLTRQSVGAFNELLYRATPARQERLEPLFEYFYPLDRVAHWNRAYGPRGFVQYQFVVPYGAERTVVRVLEIVSGRGLPTFLAVLKRMGSGEGLLSFPIEGWTLTLDIPAGIGDLAETLDQIDGLVVDAGGRVYLAKDARLRPELLPAMYPEIERWREIRRRLDPDGRFQSDLARRLQIA